MRVLLLGGTGEARRLAEALAERPNIDATLSFAGRTDIPQNQALPFRVGGFGGAEGLRAFLRREAIGCVVDATHPFAENISANAAIACLADDVPLSRFTRAPWRPGAGDEWLPARSLTAAAAMLGPEPRRVFLTVGRIGLAAFAAEPQHHYLIRSIGAPRVALPPRASVLLQRPPFDEAGERALMEREAIEVLVTKNSGGAAAAPKLAAARSLRIPVVMVDRPPAPSGLPEFTDTASALDWIDALQAERGV